MSTVPSLGPLTAVGTGPFGPVGATRVRMAGAGPTRIRMQRPVPAPPTSSDRRTTGTHHR